MQENEPLKQFVIAAPLLPDKREAYVRFVQELLGQRREAYEASRQDLGITRERFWLLETADQAVAVITLTAANAAPAAWFALLAGRRPFGRWLQRQLLELHGLNLRVDASTEEGRPRDVAWLPELIAEWTASRNGRPETPAPSKKVDNPMSVRQNVNIVRRAFHELFGGGDLAVADEVYAPEFKDNGEESGPEQMRQLVAMYHTAFPDLTAHVEEQFALDDRVVTRWRIQGTQQGVFMGVPASGRAATMRGISIHRVADGRIVEHWGQVNMLMFLQQLGAVPESGVA